MLSVLVLIHVATFSIARGLDWTRNSFLDSSSKAVLRVGQRESRLEFIITCVNDARSIWWLSYLLIFASWNEEKSVLLALTDNRRNNYAF